MKSGICSPIAKLFLFSLASMPAGGVTGYCRSVESAQKAASSRSSSSVKTPEASVTLAKPPLPDPKGERIRALVGRRQDDLYPSIFKSTLRLHVIIEAIRNYDTAER